jgi:hypothetical protein
MTAVSPDLHVDSALTNWSQEYASQRAGFIGEKVAPPLIVAKETDYYWIHGAEGFELSVVDRAPGTQYGVVDWSKSTGTYSTMGYGLSASVPKEVMANADLQVDPAKDAIQIIVDQLMLAYEKRVADLIFDTSSFTQTAALSGTDRWDTATSDPLDKVYDAKAYVRGKIGVEPNTMVIGYDVFRALQQHDGLRKIIFGLNAPEAMPTEAQLAQALGLDRILVGRATYLSAADTFTDIWGKYANICYIDPSPSGRSICPLRTMVWNVDGGRFVTRGPIWNDDVKAWKYYCDDYTDEKLISLYSSYLYSTVVS